MIANPKHIPSVKVADKVLGKNEWNQINILEDIQIDHEAINAWIWSVESRITNRLYEKRKELLDGDFRQFPLIHLNHWILRVLAVPSVSETFHLFISMHCSNV